MNIFNIGNEKIEPRIVKDYFSIRPKVLICSNCKNSVSEFPYHNFYVCDVCESITSNVEWKEDPVLS